MYRCPSRALIRTLQVRRHLIHRSNRFFTLSSRYVLLRFNRQSSPRVHHVRQRHLACVVLRCKLIFYTSLLIQIGSLFFPPLLRYPSYSPPQPLITGPLITCSALLTSSIRSARSASLDARCDASDALLKLNYRNGGFLSGPIMYSPKRQEGATKIVGPAYTVEYAVLSDSRPKVSGHYVSRLLGSGTASPTFLLVPDVLIQPQRPSLLPPTQLSTSSLL